MKQNLLLLLIFTISYCSLRAQAKIGKDIVGENSGDNSGECVSMPDEFTIAIGASANNGNGTDAGHVRIYTWNGTTWAKKGRDIDGENAGDRSGRSISMPDANTIAIGVEFNDGNGKNSGHVRIYSWNGSAWIQKGLDIDGKNSLDNFGCSVSMPDANTVAIGAPEGTYESDKGYASVYIWNGTTWVQKGQDLVGEAGRDITGHAVCMPDVNTIAVGAPGNSGNGLSSGSVRIFSWNGSAWVQKGQDIDGEDNQDDAGEAISMPDANTIAIGAKFNSGNGDNAGHVRIFTWNGSLWVQKGQDIDGEAAGDYSGSTVSMPDANTVAIGAKFNKGGTNFAGTGHVRIYTWSGTTWIQKCNDIDGESMMESSGYSVSMPNSNRVGIGSILNSGNGQYSGSARIFDVRCNTSNVVLLNNLASISPNPVMNSVTIKLNNPQEKLTLSVYDINGKLLKNETCKNTQETTMDLSQFSSGVYLLKITDSENRVVTQKITKQ